MHRTFAELEHNVRDWALVALAVDPRHGHVHGAAVGPHAVRVQREPPRQENHLREQRVDALPVLFGRGLCMFDEV